MEELHQMVWDGSMHGYEIKCMDDHIAKWLDHFIAYVQKMAPGGGAHVFRNQRLLYMNWTGSHVAIEVMMIAKNHEIWYIVFTYLTCLATSQCVLFQEFHNGIPSTSQILDIDT